MSARLEVTNIWLFYLIKDLYEKKNEWNGSSICYSQSWACPVPIFQAHSPTYEHTTPPPTDGRLFALLVGQNTKCSLCNCQPHDREPGSLRWYKNEAASLSKAPLQANKSQPAPLNCCGFFLVSTSWLSCEKTGIQKGSDSTVKLLWM